jgi:hypothetical protein
MYPVSVSWQTSAKSMPCVGGPSSWEPKKCLRPSGPRSDRFGTLGLVRGIKPGDGAAADNPDQHGSAALSREHLQRRANNSGGNRSGPAYADRHDWMAGDVPRRQSAAPKLESVKNPSYAQGQGWLVGLGCCRGNQGLVSTFSELTPHAVSQQQRRLYIVMLRTLALSASSLLSLVASLSQSPR